jgi:molybdopterin/thiamine biosynthesis adenylyltransferase/TusA-related sulfurtransferase
VSGLAEKRVAVVGMGGLGCPAALALVHAGVSRLTLVDPDRVETSNLPRQTLYRAADVGRLKVEAAAQALRRIRPGLEISVREERLGAAQARPLFEAQDLVLDGTDDVDAKLAMSDAAVATGVPLVYAGAIGLGGQAMLIAPGGPCLRCIFEEVPSGGPTCAQAGVLGTVVGVVGAIQASLGLEALVGEGRPGVLVRVDGRRLAQREIAIGRAADCPVCSARATLDITREVCPMTYVRTKLKLEAISPGELLEVVLAGEEPLRNVPRSAREEGHEVLSVNPQPGGSWRLLLRKRG